MREGGLRVGCHNFKGLIIGPLRLYFIQQIHNYQTHDKTGSYSDGGIVQEDLDTEVKDVPSGTTDISGTLVIMMSEYYCPDFGRIILLVIFRLGFIQ